MALLLACTSYTNDLWAFLLLAATNSATLCARLQCVTPYLALFLSAADAEAVCNAFLARCIEDTREKDVVQDDDDEGEELCNCEFSLAYGEIVAPLKASFVSKSEMYTTVIAASQIRLSLLTPSCASLSQT